MLPMAVGWLGAHSSGGILIHCVLPVLQACPVHRQNSAAAVCIGRCDLQTTRRHGGRLYARDAGRRGRSLQRTLAARVL